MLRMVKSENPARHGWPAVPALSTTVRRMVRLSLGGFLLRMARFRFTGQNYDTPVAFFVKPPALHGG